jgi:hypothetical protein
LTVGNRRERRAINHAQRLRLSEPTEHGPNHGVVAVEGGTSLPIVPMPSLFRLLIFLGMLSGLAYGAVYSLAKFVTLQPRQITITVSPDKFIKD